MEYPHIHKLADVPQGVGTPLKRVGRVLLGAAQVIFLGTLVSWIVAWVIAESASVFKNLLGLVPRWV